MKKIGLSFLLVFLLFQSWSQIRLTKLVLKQGEIYTIKKTDILVVDTLIMEDGSKIFLNNEKNENFIHAKYAFIGKNCLIDGEGKKGNAGKAGQNGVTQLGPCKDGGIGANGSPGIVGQPGITLSIYSTKLNVTGSIVIDLNGGDGGDGGNGGNGGDGGSGTRLCPGGNGGLGGNGSNGANGGQGGSLNIHCKDCPDLNLLMGEKILVRNFGGFGGQLGNGGAGGRAGLGQSDGQNGSRGKDGLAGKQGKQGIVTTSRD